MLDRMEFEDKLKEMGDDQLALTKFNTRQQYDFSKELIQHNKRITKLESTNRRAASIAGAIGGIIATGVVASINFFRN